MTEPAPTPDPTAAELDRMILDAARAFNAALRTYPRDQALIDASRKALEELRALKAELYPSA